MTSTSAEPPSLKARQLALIAGHILWHKNIFGVLAQLADANGSPVGDAFRANQTTSSLQSGGVVFSDQGTDVTIKDYRLSNLTNDMILVQKGGLAVWLLMAPRRWASGRLDWQIAPRNSPIDVPA